MARGEEGGAGLGAVRLAVLDPSPVSHQPIHHHTGRYHLVYNGELYNYRALRQELLDLGERLTTDGDTEVVLVACARWGVDAFSRFNGMWALAFYDSQARCGFLCRDRFGIKPLFYSAENAGLVFASELRSLTKLCDCPPPLNSSAIVQHLQFGYIVHPETAFERVRMLRPGHLLEFAGAKASEPTCYYDLLADRSPLTAEDYGARCLGLRRKLADAVVRRRISDVPIGAFLSGGLDSSIVVGHLSEATGRPVKTFAVGYEGQAGYDETAFARRVADRFATEHHELILTERDVIEAIPSILNCLGEPVGDSSIVPTALISRFAREHVTVALSGDGGDELFGGYWRYLGHAAMKAYESLPGPLRSGLVEPLLKTVGSSKSSGLGNRVRQFRKLLRARAADPLERHVAWSRILAPEAANLFVDPSMVEECDHRMVQAARGLTSAMADRDPLSRLMAFDLQYQLPADMLRKVDLASMMYSLEVRVPFLDPQIVDLALDLPARLKIDRGLRKRILSDSYRGRLPDAVLDRPKRGFELPIGEYLRGPLRPMFGDVVTRGAVESIGLISYAAVEDILQEHLDRRAEHADLLFALLSLCWWDAGRKCS